MDDAIRSAKEQAVAAYNKLKQYCKNVFIQDMLGKADSSLNSKSWTKTGHDIIKECKRGLSKPTKVNESAMRFPNGRMSKGPEEWLQVFAENLGRIFNAERPVDRRMLAKLPPYCNRPSMEDLPSPREIHTAVRRLKHSAGGIDGIQACMAKSLLRDNDLFYDYLVPMVEEFWETQRVPAGWEEMKCSVLFKKGDAADPGNYRSIMLIKITQKIVLIIIGSRLGTLIECLDIESQCGFRCGRGCRDAIFAVRLLLKKRKEHQLETWAVFVDLVKAFDTVNRDFLWEALVRFGCPESFVDRLRAIHENVIIVLTKNGKEVRFRSEGGVRQGDILGPPLFLIFMAMLCMVRASDKHTSDVSLLTTVGEKIVLHGLKGNERDGELFTVNNSLYADDAANFSDGRDDMEIDAVEEVEHLSEGGMEAHLGKWLDGGKMKTSKTEAMFFPKQDICYDDYDPVDGLSSSFDGVDLTDLKISAEAGTFIPFTSSFCYLGSLITMDLTDLPDVRNRVRKGLAVLFMIKREIFSNSKISRATKRVAYLTLVVMVALYGCESWAVTAEIERTLRSFQTTCMRCMCGVTKQRMRDDHITTVSLLKKIGVEDIMYYCRYLQLNFLGTVSRMPSSRIQRKIISSWIDEPRRPNYPQTYSRSMLKAMASVDIPEAHWQDLAMDEVLWNKYIRQTDEDRDAQRQSLFTLHYNKDPAHHAHTLALAAFPVSQDQPPVSPFSPTLHSPGLHNIVLPSPSSTPWLEGPLSAPAVSSKGTPVSSRRRDYILGGGSITPKQARGKALYAKAVYQLDFRGEDPRNCMEPGKRRDRLSVSSKVMSAWTVRDVEAIHAQFFLDVGYGPKDLRMVRLSQSGVFYWRLRQQEGRPTHRFSWMNPRDDIWKGRNPQLFITRSSGPSFVGVDNAQ